MWPQGDAIRSDRTALLVHELDTVGIVEKLGRKGEAEAHDLLRRYTSLWLEADVDHRRGSSGQEKRWAREEKRAAIHGGGSTNAGH